jgi:hypothetical protein
VVEIKVVVLGGTPAPVAEEVMEALVLMVVPVDVEAAEVDEADEEPEVLAEVVLERGTVGEFATFLADLHWKAGKEFWSGSVQLIFSSCA